MESVGQHPLRSVRRSLPQMSQIHTDVGCVIILPRMSQIHTDVGACERTRIARITRMQHKKKSVTIREICGTTFSSKIRGNPWNLWENILKQNL